MSQHVRVFHENRPPVVQGWAVGGTLLSHCWGNAWKLDTPETPCLPNAVEADDVVDAANRLTAWWRTGGWRPSMLHVYRRYNLADSRPIFAVLRLVRDGDKIIRPMTQVASVRGGMEWVLKRPPESGLNPLYNLHELAHRKDEPVWVVEGEKAADALSWGSGVLATTWPFGASSWRRADWGVLAGRHVHIWPDNDDAGKAAMDGVADLLRRGAEPATVEFVQVSGHKPKGWDAADWVDGVLAEVTYGVD